MDDQTGITGIGLPAYRGQGRGPRLHQALTGLLDQAPELEAAAVVSFDGLPMASALPLGMDEDRVAAMSAALLSLGEKAADGLGRGGLAQVYVEGEKGTVFLVSAADEAVLVAVAARGAKTGLMLWEVRRAAAQVGDLLSDAPGPVSRLTTSLPAPATEPVPYPPPEPVGRGRARGGAVPARCVPTGALPARPAPGRPLPGGAGHVGGAQPRLRGGGIHCRLRCSRRGRRGRRGMADPLLVGAGVAAATARRRSVDTLTHDPGQDRAHDDEPERRHPHALTGGDRGRDPSG